MAPFEITPKSFQGSAQPGTTLSFTFSTPSTNPRDPLHPATFLKLSFEFANDRVVFMDEIVGRDLEPVATEEKEEDGEREPGTDYRITMPSKSIPRYNLCEGDDTGADVVLHAFQGDRWLNKWKIGRIEGLGVLPSPVAATEKP